MQATGARVAQQLNRVAQRLEELQTETRERLQASVDEVNSLATAVADLNRQIVGEEASGNSSNTLRDARDLKLDRLVQLTGADVFESKDGSSRVLLGGLTLVDGTQVQPLAAVSIGGSTEVTRASLITRPVQIGGELGALRQTSVVDIPALQDDFDSLARGLVDSVNTIHRQGVTWSGQPPVATAGGPFFADDFAFTSLGDPNRKAKGIRLSDAVAASSGAIAASAATAAGPGDGSIALQIAGLRTTSTFFFAADGSPRATEPSGTFLQRIATGVAFSTRAVSDRADVDEAIASQSDSRRQSVSGVSVDEELVRLIKFQQTYAAAARLITAADGMMQTLLDIR